MNLNDNGTEMQSQIAKKSDKNRPHNIIKTTH